MIKFTLKIISQGWIEANLAAENTEVNITASFLSDAPYSLIVALTLLCQGTNEAVCLWQDEPGEYRLIFRNHENTLELSILRFEQSFSRNSNDNAQVIFYGKDDLAHFVRCVLREFSNIKTEFGTAGYRDSWGYEFPIQAYNRLRSVFIKLT